MRVNLNDIAEHTINQSRRAVWRLSKVLYLENATSSIMTANVMKWHRRSGECASASDALQDYLSFGCHEIKKRYTIEIFSFRGDNFLLIITRVNDLFICPKCVNRKHISKPTNQPTDKVPFANHRLHQCPHRSVVAAKATARTKMNMEKCHHLFVSVHKNT